MELKISTEVDDDKIETKFNFDKPENLLIQVVGDPKTKTWVDAIIESYVVMGELNEPDDYIDGVVSYVSYNDSVEYMVKDLIDFPGIGWFVIEGITGVYTPGEWGYTDDNMDFYYVSVRRATDDEIKLS